ncbi:MAG: efflux RND transporter permease subunit, partial [Oceanococcaceae bacterium]
YLPRARSDNVWANFSVPPGASQMAVREDLAEIVVQRLEPYMRGEKQPKVAYYNLSSWNRVWTGLALYPANPKEADAMMQALREDVLVGLPDTRAFVIPGSLLNFAGGGNRQVDFDIHGADLEELIDAARAAQQRINEVWPDMPVQPQPDLDLAEPELQIIPDAVRLAQVGLTRSQLGQAVRAYTDGLYVSEYFDGNRRMTVLLRGERWDNPESLAAMPIATPLAGVQLLGELARFERRVGPSELRRIDGQRTLTLRLFPPDTLTLEDIIDTLRAEVEPVVMQKLGDAGSVRYRGSADGLEEALKAMGMNLLWALLILLLILTAMFRSARDALFVVSVMPLACAGGVLALWLLNRVSYQSLDLLTMSGFVILLGLVVNNAILLVDRARSGEAAGSSRDEAVMAAVRERARPIFMSTTTSLFGMLPLMLVPGTGAEIYRGLATIIVGGLLVSALLTLFLLPSLLRLGQAQWQAATDAAALS